jgi:hypothetical protein
MLEPWITMQSESAMLRGNIVAAPRPNRVPKPGTLELCLVLDCDDTEAAHELLLDVVPFAVQRGAAERKNRRRHVDERAVFQPLDERLVACLLH